MAEHMLVPSPLEQLRSALLAVESQPNNAAAWRVLARRTAEAGHAQDAVQAAKRAANLDPNNSSSWQLLGEISARLSLLNEPILYFERAVTLDAANLAAWVLLGQARMASGDLEGAETALETAYRLDPINLETRSSRAHLLVRRGKLDEAQALLREFVTLGHPSIAFAWGQLCRLRDPERGIEPIRAALKLAHGSRRLRLLHTLGHLLDASDRITEAFETYAEANNMRVTAFDPDAYDADIDDRIARWTREACRSNEAAPGNERMVFIVGLPRSGTSLLEQMLGAHSQIYPGGERNVLPTLERTWLRMGRHLSEAKLAPLRTALGQYLDAIGTACPHITDKLPDNLLRLGLASRLAPGATVIHVYRDPLDTLWSCYRQHFGPGLAWTTRMDWLGLVHIAQQRMISHYREVVPLRWVDVRYEELVRNPEKVLTTTLQALGHALEPRCLEPHRVERQVATASALQVLEPIHHRSIGKADRYAQFLEPLVTALNPGLGTIVEP